MSNYTPTAETFRGVYGKMCAEWCRDDALAEFDRLIARIKAEALRGFIRECRERRDILIDEIADTATEVIDQIEKEAGL